jgi:hypothetical protein
VNDVPEEIRRLAERREEARAAHDFAAADGLREQIRRAGFEVTDTPGGPTLRAAEPREPEAEARPVAAGPETATLLDQPARFDASVQWLVQGWPADIDRGIASFRRHHPTVSVQHVVVDLTGEPPTRWPEDIDLVPLKADVGWAAGRNAGLLRSSGRVVVVVDGSVEPTGNMLGPLMAALDDPTVGVTGPFGIVSADLHEFQEAGPGECDAVEGYLMAFRRELVEGGLRFDPKFRFYRTADIELSFQIKAMGLRATVTPAPVVRHEHRMWASTPEDRRTQLSKRNFYRFLDRWRGRTDLLIRSVGEAPASQPDEKDR